VATGFSILPEADQEHQIDGRRHSTRSTDEPHRSISACGRRACCRIRRSLVLRPSNTARLPWPWQRMVGYSGMVGRTSPNCAIDRRRRVSRGCWRSFHLASSRSRVHARSGVWQSRQHRPSNGYTGCRKRPGRARLPVCVRQRHDLGVDDHLPEVRHREERDHADRCLPVLLRLLGLRRAFATKSGRLLRVLLLRFHAVSAHPGG